MTVGVQPSGCSIHATPTIIQTEIMLRTLWKSTRVLLALTILTSVVYPLAVTVVANTLFSQQSHGSVIERDGKAVGSELIGQAFTDPKFFWGRPSATGPYPNNAMAGSGSNLGPTNPALTDAVRDRVAKLKESDPDNSLPIPVDLVTASGSGLDPHISPAAAEYQVARVAKVRSRSVEEIRKLVQSATETPTFGVLGQPRVNVLRLNLTLGE
jgi:K+-transporting ATPase ATPase C chain